MVPFVLTVVVYIFVIRPQFQTIHEQEFPYLTLSLWLALLLTVLVVCYAVLEKWNTERLWFFGDTLKTLLAAVLVVTMTWAGLVGFLYHYPRVRQNRQVNAHVAVASARVVAGDSLIFKTFPATFVAIREYKRVRIATPENDGFQEFPALLSFHLQQGRAVYGAFTFQQWNSIKTRKLLDPRRFKIRHPVIFSNVVLCQILTADHGK